MFLSLIQNATRRISITSPYFIPDEALLSAMTTAAYRGVEVELFVGLESDHLIVNHAQRFYYSALLTAGVRIGIQARVLVDLSWPSQVEHWNEPIADNPAWTGATLDRVRSCVIRERNRPSFLYGSLRFHRIQQRFIPLRQYGQSKRKDSQLKAFLLGVFLPAVLGTGRL